MKIAFGPNDYVEMIGSGENGELTEKEFELFNSSVNKFAFKTFMENEEKYREKLLVEDINACKEIGIEAVSTGDKIIESIIKTAFFGINEYREYRAKWGNTSQPNQQKQNKTLDIPSSN